MAGFEPGAADRSPATTSRHLDDRRSGWSTTTASTVTLAVLMISRPVAIGRARRSPGPRIPCLPGAICSGGPADSGACRRRQQSRSGGIRVDGNGEGPGLQVDEPHARRCSGALAVSTDRDRESFQGDEFLRREPGGNRRVLQRLKQGGRGRRCPSARRYDRQRPRTGRAVPRALCLRQPGGRGRRPVRSPRPGPVSTQYRRMRAPPRRRVSCQDWLRGAREFGG